MGLYILVPLSVVLVFAIGIIFWWSVRSGQFDDLEGPGFRMLVDDRDDDARTSPGAGEAAPADDATAEESARQGAEQAGGSALDPDQTPPRD